jgi:hypothetical protein
VALLRRQLQAGPAAAPVPRRETPVAADTDEQWAHHDVQHRGRADEPAAWEQPVAFESPAAPEPRPEVARLEPLPTAPPDDRGGTAMIVESNRVSRYSPLMDRETFQPLSRANTPLPAVTGFDPTGGQAEIARDLTDAFENSGLSEAVASRSYEAVQVSANRGADIVHFGRRDEPRRLEVPRQSAEPEPTSFLPGGVLAGGPAHDAATNPGAASPLELSAGATTGSKLDPVDWHDPPEEQPKLDGPRGPSLVWLGLGLALGGAGGVWYWRRRWIEAA